MLRSLLSPLSSRFPLTPRPEAHQTLDDTEPAPEDFARDVLVEVMRNAVERLKVAEGLSDRTQVLVEVHGIMVQDACTKDVFREMDGFLVLMSVLATIQPGHSWAVAAPGDEIVHEVLEAVRLVFVIISEAMDNHKANTSFFERSVGYDSLAQAVLPLVSDCKTVEQTLGFLVALGVHNFSLSAMFIAPDDFAYDAVDTQLHDADPMLKFIRHPGAFRVLFASLDHFPEPKAPRLRYTTLRLLDRLTWHSHRNHAVLTSLNLVGPLFDLYHASGPGGGEPARVLAKHERQAVLKVLKRLMELGSDTTVARTMFQRAVRADETLDGEVLELLRAGMKARWPEHMSMEGAAAISVPTESRALPTAGFTFMVWLRVEKFPAEAPQDLFTITAGGARVFALQVHPKGVLGCVSTVARELPKFKPALQTGRWTHVALVHYPHRASAPTVRLFIDGVLSDVMEWQYPRVEGHGKEGVYTVGDPTEAATMSWALASAYFLSCPLGDDIPRFIQHLGPRYTSHFQASDLAKFMTYEAATSLSIFLTSVAQSKKPSTMSGLIKRGLGISCDAIAFVLTPSLCNMCVSERTDQLDILQNDRGLSVILDGDVVIVRNVSLDLSMWRLGGAALPLRLIQLANSPHELSRTLAILAGGLRNDWQNSDDMERVRGYEILADLLRQKSQLINMTGFETLFEFLGLSFRSPDQSTVINTVAYRAIALDLQLWAQTKTEIQQAHMEQFSMLLRTSRYKKFNIKQRLGKMNIVRKFIFALQTDWYQSESIPWLIDTLKVVAEAQFSTDDVIKPIVAYLAANLHPDAPESGLPQSPLLRLDPSESRLRAELVFEALVAILQHTPNAFTKFSTALPLTRICLLLLGDRPTPSIATHVLRLVECGLKVNASFGRKFELVSGWITLKTVLPQAWAPSVQAAAFDVLLGGAYTAHTAEPAIVCPHMLPVIFACLKYELDILSGASDLHHDAHALGEAGVYANSLLEELIKIHSFSPTFREAFRSQVTTQTFIDAFKSFVTAIAGVAELDSIVVWVLEKLSHLALSISLDDVVAVVQRKEILETVQTAEVILHPSTTPQSGINPNAVIQGRPKHGRRQSTRLSMHLGERTVQRLNTKIQEWRKNVTATERKRLRKNILDLREQRRQISRLTEWGAVLMTERGLWASPEAEQTWKLDETEGPYRVRKKLEPEHERVFLSQIDKKLQNLRIQEPSSDAQSVVQAATPPWAESYEISASAEDRFLEEEVLDDKHRRVRHELEAGDVIEAVETVARISGIDSFPGLLIFGRTHLYMMDGLVQNEDGEVIDASDASKEMFLIPGTAMDMCSSQCAQRWSFDQIASFSERTFLFRDVALELYFKDSRSLLVVFTGKDKRQAMGDRLNHLMSGGERYGNSLTPAGLTPAILKSPIVSRLSAKLSGTMSAGALMGFRADELATAQRKWQAREISNFTYISILNQVSGRTPSDATQYPVFPWIISDYSSEQLDFDSERTFRDLSKPMGALTEARREAAEARYSALLSVDEKPFHYGTHFSSSMIVCHFLIRMEPFTHMFKTLQGGDWDLPDRLFSDMKRAYESASQDLRGDVRELIPEFYTCPEFLENTANLDFGVQQNNGERIHHVKLPPWAKQDPLLFIMLNRQALESDYVSRNLPSWIDLIWGYKQRDPESLNVFHPLSYEGSIDLDAITDDLEREATVGIIHNFGQTPRKLFNSPHPDRMMHGTSTLPIGNIYGIPEDYHLLAQNTRVVKDIGKPVAELGIDLIGERIVPCPSGSLAVPSRPHEIVEWDCPQAPAGELRVHVDKKVVQVVESALCSRAAFADADTLVTGSTDYTVRLWKLARVTGAHHKSEPPLSVNLTHIMRGHSARVTCVAASRSWSLVVSGSQDGSAILWDLNRGTYVRSISHGEGPAHTVHLAAIQESSGYIATCSQDKLWLHTINARPVAVLDLTDIPGSPIYPPIASMAFHEREFAKVPVLATGSPDGTITLRTWNTDDTPAGERAVWEFVTLKKMKVKTPDGAAALRGALPCITALRFVGESLYHGEDSGKVYSWNLPD